VIGIVAFPVIAFLLSLGVQLIEERAIRGGVDLPAEDAP
jgi:hypothetical protein